jgi:hypothetical protein
MAKNEFEDLVESEGLDNDFSEEIPGKSNDYTETQDDIISEGSAGQKYDWSKAPEGTKAPPRVSLNGMTVTIKKAEIVLPPIDREWALSKSGKIKYKYCTFRLFYDKEGQQEFYSGVRVFEREGKYSHPSITRDMNNQASKLMGLYAKFRGKDINEVSLKEFMAFLNGQPKAVIKTETVVNPQTNAKIEKNLVDKFVA